MNKNFVSILFLVALSTVVLFIASFIFSIPGVLILLPLALLGGVQTFSYWAVVLLSGGIDNANELIKAKKDD